MTDASCHVDECDLPVRARGLCVNHYMRLRRQGDPAINKRTRYGTVGCEVEGCEREHKTHGLCSTHWYRLRTHGSVHTARSYEPRGTGGMTPAERGKAIKYGVTPAIHRAMLEAQCHQCAVCGRRVTRRSPIDHDHQTGRVRAVLCTKCNVGLGHFGDDPDRLRAAAAYLEEHRRAEASDANDLGDDVEGCSFDHVEP